MEDDGEHEHEMNCITHTDNITEYITVRDAKVWVKVREYIIKGEFTKEKETEKACGYVNSRTQQ